MILKRAIILEADETVDDIFESELWLQCKKLYFNDKDDDSKETARTFYEEHKKYVQFSGKKNGIALMILPYWENRMDFMSELMNDASSIGEKWF